MNFVFQGLALLAFILPGMLFRSAYKKAFWNYPLGRLGPITDQIPRSLVHASWINATWAFGIQGASRLGIWPVKAIDFRSVVYWLTNNFGKDQIHLERAVESLTTYPLHVFGYFFGMYAYSILWGWLIHWAVRRWAYDKKYSLFRFDNDWHYIFKGEVLGFPDYESPRKRGNSPTISGDVNAIAIPAIMNPDVWEGTLVAAIVDLKDNSYLYLGVYVDSFWDSAGNLDRMLLQGAKRRKLSNDAVEDDDNYSHLGSQRYYPIKGNFFILRMSEVKTINVAYYSSEILEIAKESEKFDRLLKEVNELEKELEKPRDDTSSINSVAFSTSDPLPRETVQTDTDDDGGESN